jgi:hypothetical protein
VFEVAPSLFMVELHKAHGDTLEYHSVSSHSTSVNLLSIAKELCYLFGTVLCVAESDTA